MENKNKFLNNKWFWIGVCVLGFLVIKGVYQITDATITKTPEQLTEIKKEEVSSHSIQARAYVEDLVSKVLVAPATAKFHLDTKAEVESANGTSTLVVFGTVDSQNGFGALLTTDFVAKLDFTGDKKGELIYLKVGDKRLK